MKCVLGNYKQDLTDNPPKWHAAHRAVSFFRCMLHTGQINKALGISGISSHEFAWRSRKSQPGAQIDLLIDRKDDVINLCEIKYAADEFAIDAAYEKKLRQKTDAFRTETGTRKALLPTMITLNGLKNNAYRNVIVNDITGDDLFRE